MRLSLAIAIQAVAVAAGLALGLMVPTVVVEVFEQAGLGEFAAEVVAIGLVIGLAGLGGWRAARQERLVTPGLVAFAAVTPTSLFAGNETIAAVGVGLTAAFAWAGLAWFRQPASRVALVSAAGLAAFLTVSGQGQAVGAASAMLLATACFAPQGVRRIAGVVGAVVWLALVPAFTWGAVGEQQSDGVVLGLGVVALFAVAAMAAWSMRAGPKATTTA